MCMCLVAWQPSQTCARPATTSPCQNPKKVCHFDGISMSMIFAPDIPHSRPPGRDVGTGQTLSRVPLSRVMVPEQFAKFVHMLFAVCLLVFVCLQPQDSIPGLPGERVAQGRALTRGPPSRVMNKQSWTKFVHRLFAVCLWEICVLAATGSSLWPAVIMTVHQDLAFSM